MNKRVEDLRLDMDKGFEINSNQILEIKVTDKLNEVIKALTR